MQPAPKYLEEEQHQLSSDRQPPRGPQNAPKTPLIEAQSRINDERIQSLKSIQSVEGVELMEQPHMPLVINQLLDTQKQVQYGVNTSFLVRPGSPRASPSAINIQQIESEDRADASKLQRILNERHPKKRNKLWEENKLTEQELIDYTCSDACCGTVTGSHLCCGTSKERSDVDQFGIGIALYFRFVKKLTCYYFLFLILSIPSLLFSLTSAAQYQSNGAFDTVLQLLTSTTLGSMGLGTNLCSVGQFNNGQLFQNFECSTGYIDFDNSFKVGIINKADQNQTNCGQFIASQINYTCQYNTPLNFNQTCDHKNQCNFTMNNTNFQSNCVDNLNQRYVYTNVYCRDSYIHYKMYALLKSQLPKILASLDAGIIFLFMFMLISLKVAEEDYINRMKFEEPQIQYFTIQLSNLPCENLSEDQLKAIVWDHIQTFMQFYIKKHEILGQENFMVFDLKVSESQDQLILQKEIRTKESYLAKRMREFLKAYNIDVLDEQDITIEKLRRLEPKINLQNKKQANSQLIQIEKSFSRLNDLKAVLTKIKKQPIEQIKYVWATFLTQEQAAIASDAFDTLPFERLIGCCYPSCLDEEKRGLILHEKFLKTKPASSPEDIIWENLYYSRKSRVIRQTVTLLSTILILLASFVVIVYINKKKNETIAKYPNISCSASAYNNISNSQLRSNQFDNGYVQCYCVKQINNIISVQLPSDIQNICGKWFKDYTFLKLLPVASVVCIILINLVIQYFFQGLSQFEKHLSISNQYTSRVQKIFFAQFLNTALILLVSNASLKIGYEDTLTMFAQFLLGGQYDDMTSQWYQNVGSVVVYLQFLLQLLTILINIITTPVFLMIEQMLKVIQRCCDRGCSFDRSKTKQKTMKQLVELYSGPEFLIDLRYAQILNVSFVCMMYGAGMPVLYFFTTITLIILYWLDKIWLFLFYRTPVNFDDAISKTARGALWVVSVVHCGFAIYIYGNQNLFYNPDANSLLVGYYDKQGLLGSIWQRVNFSYNVVLFALLALFVFIFVVRYLIVEPFGKIITGFTKLISKPAGDPNYSKPVTHFLTDYQLEREVKLLQYQMEQSTHAPYQTLLKAKQQYLIDFLNTPFKPHSKNLQGKQSYDIAYNDKYGKCIDWNLIEQIAIKDDEIPKEGVVEDIYKGIVERDVVVEM